MKEAAESVVSLLREAADKERARCAALCRAVAEDHRNKHVEYANQQLFTHSEQEEIRADTAEALASLIEAAHPRQALPSCNSHAPPAQ